MSINTLTYEFQGQNIALEIRFNTKRNIILRAVHAQHLRISAPKWFSQKQLIVWLNQHPDFIAQSLQKAPKNTPQNTMPSAIWYRGTQYAIEVHDHTQIAWQNGICYLPAHLSANEQKTLLRQYLYREAKSVLLDRLREHACRMQLTPAAMALSKAHGFWGVCRSKTGIRLNWRLIGAPDFVIDYVCVHELCHLPHPNHSTAFWAEVARHTPHTQAAKTWLKQYGKDLFLLD
ncbi:MAG: SprT family zinc-dependent metalloprotease [Neisseria sp.]|nr:SprT family zinc-dependent metalloprotease [Neisseria sp.]